MSSGSGETNTMFSHPLRRLIALAGLGVSAHLVLVGCQAPIATGGPVSPVATINEIFGPVAPQALAIAQCESGLNPRAVSPTNDFGLFQVNGVHQNEFTRVTGRPWSEVFSPYWNVVYAKHLYDSSGWQPWSCRTRVGL